jgi:hypothetical protein
MDSVQFHQSMAAWGMIEAACLQPKALARHPSFDVGASDGGRVVLWDGVVVMPARGRMGHQALLAGARGVAAQAALVAAREMAGAVRRQFTVGRFEGLYLSMADHLAMSWRAGLM